jgi:hypothetical protein
MSLLSWRLSYYSRAAIRVSAEDAVAHSIRKWEGLQPDAMAKHGVRWCVGDGYRSIVDQLGDKLDLSETCALCHRFYDEESESVDPCSECPLSISRGGESCTWPTPEERKLGIDSPWANRASNPAHMLAELRKIPVTPAAPETHTGA